MQRFFTRARRAAHRVDLWITTRPIVHEGAYWLTRQENRFWRAVSEVLPCRWVFNRCVTTADQLFEWGEILGK